jgi:DNA end-binding protein Ku
MPRAIWSGSLSFGLVNIPIKMMAAVKDKDVRFHLLHAADGARVKNKHVCSKDGQELNWADIVKGYEVSPDTYVTLTDEEMEGFAAEATRRIDIVDFVDLQDIDPAFFDSPYFLVPDQTSAKSYGLLHEALAKAKKVGIAKMVMRGKAYLVAVRPKKELLLCETMRYAEELVPPAEALGDIKIPAKAADKREVAMAQQIIDTLAAPFDPEKYRNEYRDKVLEVIEKKSAGGTIVAAPSAKAPKGTTDLMDALQKSLEAAKKRLEMKA